MAGTSLRKAKLAAATPFFLISVATLLGGCGSVEHKPQQVAPQALTSHQPGEAAGAYSSQTPELDENATIDDYLLYAQLNNPGLKAAFDWWRAALEKVPQAKSLPDPLFSYGYFIRNIETRVGPQRHRFELMQKFPSFGKLGLRGEIALAGANAARDRYEQERLNLLYRVNEAYYEYYYLGRATEITEQNLDLIKRLEEVASTRFRAGGAQQDVLKAQVELGKLADRLASLRDMRGALAAKLNAELNRPIDTPVPWPKEVKQGKLKFSEEKILQLARTGNWELKALSFEVDRSQKMLALAKKEFWPDFGLGVNYIATGEPWAGSMTPGDAGKDAVAAMVSVNLPVWRDRLHAAVREARAALEAAIEETQQKENLLLSKVRFSLYKYNDAVRQMRLYDETLIPKADQTLSASQAGYRAGKVDFVNLIEGERELLAFRLAHERALTEHRQRIAELELLVGQAVAEPAEQEQKPPTDVPGIESTPPVDRIEQIQ